MGRALLAHAFHASLLLRFLVVTEATSRTHSSLRLTSDGSRGEQAAALGHEQEAASNAVQAGRTKSAENMKYLLRTLEKFKALATSSKVGVEERHKAEEARLQASLGMTTNADTQMALKQSMTSNAESLVETDRVYSNMVSFAQSMTNFLSASSKGAGCESVTCGPHASCTETTLGAQCICNEGYVGTGQDCAAPSEFLPHKLIQDGSSNLKTQARDINVALFGKNKIAVVFTDAARADVGRLVIGDVKEAGDTTLAPPDIFTETGTKAFSPMVTGTDSDRLLLVWRDQDTEGLCWMRGAALGVAGIRGADQHITWSKPINFCRHQAHKMAMVSLPDDRAIVLFADKVKATAHSPAEHFGSSMLVEVGKKGDVTTIGTFRFADFAVCRLEVTKLTPRKFVIAARGAQVTDDLDTSVKTAQEAIAIFGEASGDDLVFDPNTLNIEPSQSQIWARGISLIAPNTFAYAYQEGKSQKIMMSVVKVDDLTHHMQVLSGPTQIREGVSPYVNMLSLPYTVSDPHTLMYYQGEAAGMVNICSWDAIGMKLHHCEDFPWLSTKITSVSGVHLGGGKSFMVFAPESGVPYYAVFGLSKK